MEEKNVPILKTWLNFGLIIALILIVLELIYSLSNIPRESYIRLISYLIFIGGLIWASKSYRDIHSDGLISYGKSFSIAFLTGLLASVVVAIFTYILLAYIDSSIIRNALDMAEERLLSNPDLSDKQIDQAMYWTAKMMRPIPMAIMGFVWNTVVVVVISLIVSAFIKKEKTPF